MELFIESNLQRHVTSELCFSQSCHSLHHELACLPLCNKIWARWLQILQPHLCPCDRFLWLTSDCLSSRLSFHHHNNATEQENAHVMIFLVFKKKFIINQYYIHNIAHTELSTGSRKLFFVLILTALFMFTISECSGAIQQF